MRAVTTTCIDRAQNTRIIAPRFLLASAAPRPPPSGGLKASNATSVIAEQDQRQEWQEKENAHDDVRQCRGTA
ncbi:MAG: hypothetical protein J2P53_11605 [Bradyrhizobiaceae bacterium]|nr:hypothetical protein [Bradyrhizobiaceae bacterium]